MIKCKCKIVSLFMVRYIYNISFSLVVFFFYVDHSPLFHSHTSTYMYMDVCKHNPHYDSAKTIQSLYTQVCLRFWIDQFRRRVERKRIYLKGAALKFVKKCKNVIFRDTD